jgi:hypothetical protein
MAHWTSSGGRMTRIREDLAARLWRARRRHDAIEARVVPDAGGWLLSFRFNDRRMLTWRFPTREAACADADRRLSDLQRAGWNPHW